MPENPPQVTITLVSALRECNKCNACEAMIRRLQERFPGRIVFHKVRADDPEAAEYGVLMPPMLILDGFLLSAGNVPIESGLVTLVAEQLGEESAT